MIAHTAAKGEHKQTIPPPETTHTPYSETKSKRGRKKKICMHNTRIAAVGVYSNKKTRSIEHVSITNHRLWLSPFLMTQEYQARLKGL
jgi:hypothetical protein